MKNSFLVILSAFAVLLGTASATSDSCVNVNFPGFFNVGECVSSIGNTCNGMLTDTDYTQFMQLINCSVAGISSLTLGSQVSLLSGLITYFGSGVQGSVGPLVKAVLRNLCTGSNSVPGCNPLQLGNNSICQDPITFSLPSGLGVETCINNLTQVCQNGQPATASVIQRFFDTLTCLARVVFDTRTNGAVPRILCTILRLIQTSTGGNALINSTLKFIQGVTDTTC